ncbi:hypothetical protein PINS_up004449 [Pythium insidiosum]|nr:hypothetical protein PINS_up004449 [Pythium insidiosum]
MARNSLEQLCINFTNETLQQQFNRHVFVLEQERYAREGIAFASVEFQDNQPCLDLIQRPPTGLLPLLEEQMLLKRKTTDKQLLTIYHSHHLDRHAHYRKPRFDSDEFVVRHYAGDVTYDVTDFIAKNTDNLHDDLLDLLRRSSHPLLRAIFAAPPPEPASKPRGAPSPAAPGKPTATRSGGAALTGTTTVTSRFRLQLAELMDVLWATAPHYVKCIKPNNLKFPGGFSSDLVRHQLVYSGVLEVVRIRQDGFPIRRRFELFYDAFWPLLSDRRWLPTARRSCKPQALAQFYRDATERLATEALVDKRRPATAAAAAAAAQAAVCDGQPRSLSALRPARAARGARGRAPPRDGHAAAGADARVARAPPVPAASRRRHSTAVDLAPRRRSPPLSRAASRGPASCRRRRAVLDSDAAISWCAVPRRRCSHARDASSRAAASSDGSARRGRWFTSSATCAATSAARRPSARGGFVSARRSCCKAGGA